MLYEVITIFNFKAQAVRNPALLQQTLKSFERIQTLCERILEKTHSDENIRRVGNIRSDSLKYADAVSSLLASLQKLDEIAGQRGQAGENLMLITRKLMDDGMNRNNFV